MSIIEILGAGTADLQVIAINTLFLHVFTEKFVIPFLLPVFLHKLRRIMSL
jgi:hypothetical protein